jgi:hypothetical protein
VTFIRLMLGDAILEMATFQLGKAIAGKIRRFVGG